MNLENLKDIQKAFSEAMDKYELESEAFWNCLSMDEQIMVFCAVCRRIHKGDVEDKGTYRYVLYDVCNFDESAYAVAQLSGYLTIHNLIGDGIECNESKILE